MDTKIQIHKENPLLNIASQTETELFCKNFEIKTDDAVLLEDNYDVTVKAEVKSDTHFPEDDLITHQQKQCKAETVIGSNNCEIGTKIEIEEQILVSDFDSQNEKKYHPESAVMKVKMHDSETDKSIDIKEEPLWHETESLAVCGEIKDEAFHLVESLGSCTEASCSVRRSKSPLSSAEDLRKVSCCMGNNHPVHGHSITKCHESYVANWYSVGRNTNSEESNKCNDGNICHMSSYLNQINLINEGIEPCRCTTCERKNSTLSNTLIHEDRKPHEYHIFKRLFSMSSSFKSHNLINESKKPHQCEICKKVFTRLSSLKNHNLIHEGKKPHRCEICEKRFIRLSDLKSHNLIHGGNKPHRCEICEKRFIRFSDLKSHHLIHDSKRPHECKICQNRFKRMADLKRHIIIHEDKKTYKCEICEKRFKRLSDLKSHNLIHEDKKTHKCEICERRFKRMPDLRRHNLIHEGKKPHKCKICGERFIWLSYLKSHNLKHGR